VEEELRLIFSRLETFAAKVQDGLQLADFQRRRDIIRALVKRVEVDAELIRVVFRVSPASLASSSDDVSPNWQHWGRRVHARTLHRHMRTTCRFEPIQTLKQLSRHRAKGPNLCTPLPIGAKNQQTGHNYLLMNINPATAWVYQIHFFPHRIDWMSKGGTRR
jgi:hypothetical protein